MVDFGAVPEGERFGLVPAFVLRDSGVKPGPKALYASLCTNADAKGVLWRSIDRLAGEFAVTKRQIQRWINDLEAAGLMIRLTRRDQKSVLLVIRDPAGRNWARQQNIKTVISRRIVAVPYGREGARRKNEQVTTPTSSKHDTIVMEAATPMSPKHNLLNMTPLTDQRARQKGAGSITERHNRDLYGLKQIEANEKGELIHATLNALAEQIGWEAVLGLSSNLLVARLVSASGNQFSEQDAAKVLLLPGVR